MKINISGRDSLIDECNLDLIRDYNWCWVNGGYLRGTGGKYRNKYLHRIIAERMGFDLSRSNEIDHRDGNPSNNQQDNLRLATRAQNQQNKKKPKNNASGFKGVYWDKERQKWRAYITIQIKGKHKRIWLKRFDDKEDAARDYDKAALKYFGEYARLNFPNKIESPKDLQ